MNKISETYKSSIVNILLPIVKEQGIIDIIVEYQLNIESYEIKQNVNKVNKKQGTFDNIKTTISVFNSILDNNYDLKVNDIRSNLKRLLYEIENNFEKEGINFFLEYRKLKQENEELKEENEELQMDNQYLKSKCEHFGIIDVDDLPID